MNNAIRKPTQIVVDINLVSVGTKQFIQTHLVTESEHSVYNMMQYD